MEQIQIMPLTVRNKMKTENNQLLKDGYTQDDIHQLIVKKLESKENNLNFFCIRNHNDGVYLKCELCIF